MRKPIVNQNTLNLAHRQLMQEFKKTYLILQRYLLHCLEWAGNNQEKRAEIKQYIKEAGELYKEGLNNLEKSSPKLWQNHLPKSN